MATLEELLLRITAITGRGVSIRPRTEGDQVQFRAWVMMERASAFAGNRWVTITGHGDTIEAALNDLGQQLGC